jgi:quinoprotein glucose dehydrogenase
MPRLLDPRIAALALAVAPLAFAADIDVQKTVVASGAYKPLVTDDRPFEPILAPTSGEGLARIRQFQLAPGLKVDLWAGEPLLANPVAFSMDEKGRIFTSETYRYRTSVLDIRHYMFMLEDDLASRTIEDRLGVIRKWFGPEGEKQLSRETEVIRMIEDVDGDGRADKSSVFADRFNSPLSGIGSGVLAWRGDVWFTEIPSLWRFTPGTASGTRQASIASDPRPMAGYRADELLRGFGVRFSFTGHDLHGLKVGPDGRLYFSVGDRGAHVVGREKQVIDIPDEGGVFRCELDGSSLELVHKGLRNPQELAFDERGDLFTGDNDSDLGDRERWVRIVDGADSGWRVGHQHAPLGNAGMWNLERLWVPQFAGQASYILPPIANIGDGPGGLVYDYGTSLPGALKGRFLLAYFKGTSSKSGVYSLAVEPRGASHVLTAHDSFVWNALVPDVDLGTDGSIWFADWHEGWPKSNKGRIYRAKFPEVTSRPEVAETARILGEGCVGATPDRLIAWLGHADLRVRTEAHLELGRRLALRKPGTDELERRLGSLAQVGADERVRIHAVWALGVAGRTNVWRSPLLALLRAEHGEVAVQATRSIGWWVENQKVRSLTGGRVGGVEVPRYDRFLQEALLALMNDGSPRQRVAATEVLGKAGWRGFVPALRSVVQKHPVEADPVWRTVAAAALARHPAAKDADAWNSDNDVSVRTIGLLASRRRSDPAIRSYLSDADPMLVVEAARAINDVPVVAAYPALAGLGDAASLDPLLKKLAAFESPLNPKSEGIRDVRADQPLPWKEARFDPALPLLHRILNANFRLGTPESARRLATLAGRADLPETLRGEALLALGNWAKPPARDRVVGVYRPLKERDDAPAREALAAVVGELLTNSPVAVRIAVADSAASLGLRDALPRLEQLVLDTNAPASARASSLRAMARIDAKVPGLKSVIERVAQDPAEVLRLEASRIGAELNPSDAVGLLTAKLTGGSVAEQQSAFASLGSLSSDAADAVLSDWLERLVKREVANEVMLDLVEAARQRKAEVVKTRLAAYQEWKLPKDHLTPYREALFGGDAARGRKAFYENAAVACTRCHQIGADGGGNAGPKLDGLAGRVTREHLLESVIFPNRQILEGFATVLVKLKNGQELAGIVKRESDTEIILLSPEDGEVTVKKSDVARRDPGLSGMPEGMASLLTLRELRDVVEFLGTLK